MKPLIGTVAVIGVFAPSTVSAQDTAKGCAGYFAQVRSSDAPVFAEPDLTSAVIGRLKTGEPNAKEICYLGEQNRFAIIEWHKEATKDGEPVRLAYVQKSALVIRRPQGAVRDRSVLDRVRSFYYSIANGIPPDQVGGPLGPLMNTVPEPLPSRGVREKKS
jgi:hypothetical protein